MAQTMVVGVDVNHPGVTEKVLSSISAAVGSFDENMSCYSASIRVQRKERDEMVRQIGEMIGELLAEYYEQNKAYPTNVIIFRDGVSEGQLKNVIDIELKNIQ